MSKLYINYKSLNNNFIPNINKTIYDYNQLINLINELDIPTSFSYKSFIKNLAKEVNVQRDNILKIKNYVITNINTYQSIINDFYRNTYKK